MTNPYPPNHDPCETQTDECATCHEQTNEEYEEELRTQFLNKLNNFTDRILHRFDQGRKKYGNKLTEINFSEEIQQEVDDIVIYNLMSTISLDKDK